MRGIIYGLLFTALIYGGGCMAYKKAFVATHDAIDEALDEGKLKLPGTTPAQSNEIKPDPAVRYSYGTEKDGNHTYEIWVHNWHGMSVRVHCNPGEFRDNGIPANGHWYPINMAVAPEGTVTMQKTDNGAVFTAKDFVSTNGQKYRFEGFRADGLKTMSKVYRMELPQNKFGGTVFAWYASVE